MKLEGWQLAQRQSLRLEVKVERSKLRIREFHKHLDGEVYVATSGGIDSRVLVHIVREVFPDTLAMHIDTGMEFPENRNHLKTMDNVTWIKPTINPKQVIEKCGYPVVSKMVAMAIHRYRNTTDPIQKKLRLYGGINPNTGRKQTMGVIPRKWHYLIDAPFKISEQCCDIMKINPAKKFTKKTGLKPILGMMADDSHNRKVMYLKYGCNSFEQNVQSNPLGFWKKEDIWNYIRLNKLSYSKVYDMGYDRTGCMFCMFGCHMEKPPNRFQKMARTHPSQHRYCMEKMGLRDVLDYMDIEYEPEPTIQTRLEDM